MASPPEAELGGVAPAPEAAKEPKLEPSCRALALSVAVSLTASVAVANLIALAWLGIGQGDQSSTEATWLREVGLEEESFGVRYAVALHWALCQFTLASSEVVPTNMSERAFATFVPILAIVVLWPLLGSTVVSLSDFWARPRGRKAQADGPLPVCTILLQAGALLLIALVLVLLLALCWYALGNSGYMTWVLHQGLEDRTTLYKYVIALHWTVCQFTFASMEVVPFSTGERIFSCLVALLATVLFYPLMGGIVIWLARLKACRPAKRAG